jgi:ABC-2 type transport system permease protein
MLNFFREIYVYREMLKSLVRKDLRTRYKGSFLGFLWTFINPLMMLVVYSLIFPYLMRIQEKNYAMFLFVALLPWLYFANSLQISAGVIINNGNLVKKIYFPRQILPLSVATAGLMNYIYGLVIVFSALIISGIGIRWVVIFLPLVIAIQYIMVIGFCLILSSANVYFRDLEHILNILTMAWFYVTPVIYPVEIFPEHLKGLLYWNPMTPMVLAYRDILYYGKIPQFNTLYGVTAFAILIIMLGMVVFNKLQANFAEEI